MIKDREKEALYTSKKFCGMTGITPETLRHYVDLGLIAPAEIKENGYRKFSVDNAVEMFYLRHERGLGASLQQFHPENEAESLLDQQQRYEQRLNRLETRKMLLERQIERTRYYQKLIQRAIAQRNEPLIFQTGRLFSLSFLEFSAENLSKKPALETIEEWMQVPELLHMAFRIAPSEIASAKEEFTTRVGLGIRTEFAQQAGLSLAEAETGCGSNRIAMLVARSEKLTTIPRSAIAPLLNATDNGQKIKRDLVGRMITRIKEEGKLWYYFTCTADLEE